jgi:hypothetical protein
LNACHILFPGYIFELPLLLNLFPISQSSEKTPAPKAKTVKVINKNGNGAA